MAGIKPVSILLIDFDRHPAFLAWRQINRGKYIPRAIEVLKQHKKSEIYRLKEGASGGWTIIAKRCLSEGGNLERLIYEKILPSLPISQLRYFGCVEKSASDLWIFLEDAGTQHFLPTDDSHRLLAAYWLGALHLSARKIPIVESLPSRGPAHYFDLMQIGRENIVQNLENPALTPEYLDILKSVLKQMESVETNWGDLTKLCKDFPQTMIHADFQPKNICVKQGPTGDILYVMDWEKAGWGIPILDLAPSQGLSSSQDIDLSTYLTIAQEFWQNLDMPTLQFAIHIGCVFRRLAAVYWSSKGLSYPWVEKPVLSIEFYQKELAYALTQIFGENVQ